MNLDGEKKAYEAAGILADELPYWGWLDRRPFCLTRKGELVCIARMQPALMDGNTPRQLDTIHNRWQRLLSQLPAGNTRFYFYFLRRPLTYDTPVEATGGVGELAQQRRREFLAARLQQIQTYVAWSHDPGLKQAVRTGPGLANAMMAGPKAWLRKRRRPDEAAYYSEEIERAAVRFGQLVEGSATLVSDITPIEILEADEAHAFLSELVNRPGLPPGGSPAGSAVNWRLAVSELEAERRFLRLDGEPVALYSMLSAARPGTGQHASRALRSWAGPPHCQHGMAAEGHRRIEEGDPDRSARSLLEALQRRRSHAGDGRHLQRHGGRDGRRRGFPVGFCPRRAGGGRCCLRRHR